MSKIEIEKWGGKLGYVPKTYYDDKDIDIDEIKNKFVTGLLLSCGKFSNIVKPCSVNEKAMEKWHTIAKEVDWIIDDRKKLYIFNKIIQGYSMEEALNMVIGRFFLVDPLYKKLI